ncbi:MAG: hypothetical protein PHX20_00590 [Candidatus Omnitrophica bacterium]|nr:hypothetical protein [Candidatus Omnitrophota bacterium]MDD5436032.1 hypothetical protein [Candidatus Omnitrophota bacterium]
MNKKVALVVAAAVALNLSAVSFAAEKKAATPAHTEKTPAKAPASPRANFGMVAGTLTAIDNSDPANVKVTVKNDADGSTRTISVTPWTNITKVTDISELKTGEQVRMMTRKVENKDVAMGIMFGKVKTMPAPAAKTTAPQTAPAAPKVKK